MSEQNVFIGDPDDKRSENLRETGKNGISLDDNVELIGERSGRRKNDVGNVSGDVKRSKKSTSGQSTVPQESPPRGKVDHSYSDTHSTPEKLSPPVKTLTDLKKVLPKLKIHPPEMKTLKELSSPQQPLVPGKSHPTDTREQLRNYCRTCAGLKIPLVDIFGEKGQQMRLNQQMKHLEQIDVNDGLSTHMCMDCICDLKMSYKFFMQIKKAQVKLKSLVSIEEKSRLIPEVPRKKSTPEPLKLSGKSPTKLATKPPSEPPPTPPPPPPPPPPSPPPASPPPSPPTPPPPTPPPPPPPPAPLSPPSPPSPTFSPPPPSPPPASPTPPPPTPPPASLPSPRAASDTESIEEFDPDDNPPDTDPQEQSELLHEFKHEPKDPEESFNPEEGEAEPLAIDLPPQDTKAETLYQYDSALSSYIKLEPSLLPQAADLEELEERERVKVEERDSDSCQSLNSLKRRGRDSLEYLSSSEGDTILKSRDPKLQKLMGSPLNVSPSNEEGIMYVTVKGAKPNELLLVKVKKMEKNGDKKEDKSMMMKKPFDLKTLKSGEKILKPFKSPESPKENTRGAIIEQQIEQYKRKREQILGGTAGLPNALKFEDGAVRFVNPVQSTPETSDDVKHESSDDSKGRIRFRAYSSIDSEDNRPLSTKEYLAKFARLKRKWEEAKAKKAALQEELSASYNEDNLEKLTRILGEREKNLHDFQDYLRQRKIVITKLKDEDIISLYEGRTLLSDLKRKFPDLIDVDMPMDGLTDTNFLDCDYCIQTFSSRDVLEEHLKTHDFKLNFFCEDCGEQFTSNKSKRAHNVTCIKKLICKFCDVMLESKGKKRQHEQKHCDNIYGQLCDICGEKFKHQGTLDQHIKTQHMSWEKVFECPKCPKKFAFRQKLSFHLKTVHTTMRAYLCEDCGADFKNPASLRHHRIRKHHPTGHKRECPVCHKMVPFYSLSKHMYTHKAYTIQCPHCDKMFKNSSTLKQHVRIHEDQRQYRCDTCGVGFNRRDGLRLHLRVHQKTDSRALKECSCQICSEKFPNHSMLVIHRNRVHKDGKQYTCQICNRSMLSTRSLEWHMSHIHNETPPGGSLEDGDSNSDKRRVTCNHCLKTFKTEMILRTHIKNTHMEKNPVKCLDCEETFTSEVRLRHHMMVTHNRLEGTLTCPHCPKRFVNQLRLKTHMISHSEDRPFTCEICGFNLKTKIQLIKHHQNRHSDERPLQCRYCPWRCKQVSALVCHERTHTNERPYSCIVCKQKFKYLGDKNKHERRHESLGGSGFKRIVSGRNAKKGDGEDDTSEEQEQDQDQEQEQDQELDQEQIELEMDQEYEIEGELGEEFEEGEEFDSEAHIVKFEGQEIEAYPQEYQQEYETSREASEAAEVIMSMEDATVYTEEVTADNIEAAEMITDDIMTSQILQSGTVVHIQQQDDDGKIQVIPVMLSLPDLSDTGTEVNLATASIMYNSG